MKAGNPSETTSQRFCWSQSFFASMFKYLTSLGCNDKFRSRTTGPGGGVATACWTTMPTSLLLATGFPFEYTITFAVYCPGAGYAWLMVGIVACCPGESLSWVQWNS